MFVIILNYVILITAGFAAPAGRGSAILLVSGAAHAAPGVSCLRPRSPPLGTLRQPNPFPAFQVQPERPARQPARARVLAGRLAQRRRALLPPW